VDDQYTGQGYPELFRLASAQGLQELDVNVLQIPSDANQQYAVVVASARTARGLFRAVGEAYRSALPEHLRHEILGVAELRAKSTVLAEAAGVPRGAVPVTVTVGDEGAKPGSSVIEPARSGTTPRPVAAEASASAMARAAQAEEPKQVAAPTAKRGDEAAADVARPEATRVAQQPAPAGAPTAMPESARPATRPPVQMVPSEPTSEALGADVVARLLQMTRRKASLEGADSSEEEALRKLDSFFQRAFGHPMSEATRMEGQRVVQRLASDLARLSTDRPDAPARTGS
jgi:hypothetical protein